MDVYVRAIGDMTFGVVFKNEMVLGSNFGVNSENVLQSFNQMFPSEAPFKSTPKPTVFAEQVVSTIAGIYAGRGADGLPPLGLDRFPAYTQRVLRAVARIPVGFVASYGGVADAVGGGARAVGNAMANNCFAPLVPCHRVVSASLGLGGYGGGLRVKYEFLKREKRGYTEPTQVSTENGNLNVFPVEFVLKKYERKQ